MKETTKETMKETKMRNAYHRLHDALRTRYLRFEEWGVYRLRRLCGRPTPMKRLVAVFLCGGILAAANIYIVVASVYEIGRRDAEKEWMQLPQHNDSIRLIEQHHSNNEYSNGTERTKQSN
jgi:hypothetical protein